MMIQEVPVIHPSSASLCESILRGRVGSVDRGGGFTTFLAPEPLPAAEILSLTCTVWSIVCVPCCGLIRFLLGRTSWKREVLSNCGHRVLLVSTALSFPPTPSKHLGAYDSNCSLFLITNNTVTCPSRKRTSAGNEISDERVTSGCFRLMLLVCIVALSHSRGLVSYSNKAQSEIMLLVTPVHFRL